MAVALAILLRCRRVLGEGEGGSHTVEVKGLCRLKSLIHVRSDGKCLVIAASQDLNNMTHLQAAEPRMRSSKSCIHTVTHVNGMV